MRCCSTVAPRRFGDADAGPDPGGGFYGGSNMNVGHIEGDYTILFNHQPGVLRLRREDVSVLVVECVWEPVAIEVSISTPQYCAIGFGVLR